jgi:FkbH-like protein
MSPKLNGLLVSDFTCDVLQAFLTNLPEEPSCQVELSPFGQTINILKDPSGPLWQNSLDFMVVWTQVMAVVPSFKRVLRFEDVPQQDLLSECDVFIDALKEGSSRARFVFVPSWSIPEFVRGYGPIDLKKANGFRRVLLMLNQRLIDGLSELPNVFILSTERWLQMSGDKACDPRLWYLSKVPYDPSVFRSAAADIKAALCACLGGARKLIVVDLDNTLWGGIVGDDGWQHLHLGGHDAQGEAFVDFQHVLKSFKERGIILAIASKNEESVALEAMERHPEMVLKKSDFAAWRINWNDKAQNIDEILKELNLTREAAVFIDDNPRERERVRQALPGVLVPEWPENSLLYTKKFLSLTCFDTIHISDDDRKRSHMYAQERERGDMRAKAQNLEEWLVSLDTTVNIKPLTEDDLPRATQLLNKTNQMNLTTRRLSEQEFKAWAEKPGNRAWVFRVLDKLGDSGLTGIASISCQGQEAFIVDFILSCRVFGRKVEDVMARTLVQASQEQGASQLKAKYLMTEKNGPCLDFFNGRSGFIKDKDGLFVWDLAGEYPVPTGITIKAV